MNRAEVDAVGRAQIEIAQLSTILSLLGDAAGPTERLADAFYACSIMATDIAYRIDDCPGFVEAQALPAGEA